MRVQLREVTRGFVRFELDRSAAVPRGELKIFELPGGCWQLASSLPGLTGAWNFASLDAAVTAAEDLPAFIERSEQRRKARTSADAIIVRLNRGDEHCYVLWDPVCARPATAGLTRAELEAVLREEVHRRTRASLHARLARVDETGTSAYRGRAVLIAYNRAGPDEAPLTMAELFVQAMERREQGWPW
jgi:hypothetical protein